MDSTHRTRIYNGPVGAIATLISGPAVFVVRIDQEIKVRETFFREALFQNEPLVTDPALVKEAAELLRKFSAHPRGLTQEAAERLVQTRFDLRRYISGTNTQGKCAEVVAVKAYKQLHVPGGASGMINAPKNVSRTVSGYRINPDSCSSRDLLVELTANGKTWFQPGPQVKSGRTPYVSRSLSENSLNPLHGKVGVIDAARVVRDGSPRIGSGGFTPGQASKMKNSGVHLRGAKGLHKWSKQLDRDIRKAVEAERKGEPWQSPMQREMKVQMDYARSWEYAARSAGRDAAFMALFAVTFGVGEQAYANWKGDREEKKRGTYQTSKPPWWKRIDGWEVLGSAVVAALIAGVSSLVRIRISKAF